MPLVPALHFVETAKRQAMGFRIFRLRLHFVKSSVPKFLKSSLYTTPPFGQHLRQFSKRNVQQNETATCFNKWFEFPLVATPRQTFCRVLCGGSRGCVARQSDSFG